MQILNLREAGCSNILMWAISNKANIKKDLEITEIINQETFYLVTLGDVNAFELFRLTQVYRTKLRITNMHNPNVPPRSYFTELFPKNEELVEGTIKGFTDIATQMQSDDDIIHGGAARLFLPMITCRYDVQIPISFSDLMAYLSEEEAAKIFNSDYPKTLQPEDGTGPIGLMNGMAMGFDRLTNIIRYPKEYQQYLKVTKYFPLKKAQQQGLYKMGLLGFCKTDNVAKTEVRCSLFKITKNMMNDTLKKLSRINSPLEVDVIIQLPIYYMQILENYISPEDLRVTYPSDMPSMLDNEFEYDDFKTCEYTPEDDEMGFNEHVSQVGAYKIRIAEATNNLMNTLVSTLTNPDTHQTSAFSLIPAIYPTNAVLSVNQDRIKKLMETKEPLIAEIFRNVNVLMEGIARDIKAAK